MRKLISSETVLAASIVIGIVVPPVSALLRPYLYVFVFFLMLFSLLTIDVRNALPGVYDSKRLAKIVGWQMLILPVGIGVCHWLVPAIREWTELMFITACAGSIFGAPAFARVMGLDAVLTLRGVIAGTLLMPIILPLLAPLVATGATQFDIAEYGARFFIFIVVPIGAAFLYQSRRADQVESDIELLRGLTILFLALFGVAIMDGIGARFLSQPADTTGLLVFALATHGIFFGLSALVFLRWDRREALTAGLLSGYRNLAVVLAVGGALLPPGFVVFVALWQIPMYMTPLVVRYCGGRASGA